MGEVDSFKDLVELGIDCDSVSDEFNLAAGHLPSLVDKLDQATLLALYGWYKQGCEGQCNAPKPSFFNLKAKSKWEAWKALNSMPKKEAQRLYVEKIRQLDPEWTKSKESWVSVSTLRGEIAADCEEKSVFDHAKEENTEKLVEMLEIGPELIDQVDEQGLGLIHWAADRGSVKILEVLVEYGADVDLRDGEGQTGLHYAASSGHLECLRFLLERNARKNLKDGEGMRALDLAADEDVKELLINF